MTVSLNTYIYPSPKDFCSCVFGFKDEYAILDGHVVVKLPSMKPVSFRYPIRSAVSTPGFLVTLFGDNNGVKRMGIFCPVDWSCIAAKAIRGLSLNTVSSSGRYVVVRCYASELSIVRDSSQLVDLYSLAGVKLWMLLSSLLRAKSPLLTKGCYHPIVFSFIVEFFTRV